MIKHQSLRKAGQALMICLASCTTNYLKKLFAIALPLALCTTGFTQSPDNAKLDQFFDRLIEKNKAMGSLNITQNGKTVYSRTIGYSQVNGAEKKPITGESRFRIGSITKMFTAVMIFQLVEQGKLTLTDTLSSFLPQIPNAGKITIAQLLAHRSGIPNVHRDQDAQAPGNTGPLKTIPITKEEMLALITKATPLFEPGTKFSYSNSGYYLLGLILEKITGKPYATLLKERITSKIGLNDTYTATGNIDVSKNESITYLKIGDEWKQVPETHPSILFSAGSIVSTPKDLATFIKALFDLKLISQKSLTAMKTVRDGGEMGMGMEPYTFAGKTFYGHAGGADNYGAWLAYQPEEKLAIAYTTNAKVYPVINIMNGIADIYFNKPFQIPTFESLAISEDILEKYVGVYSSTDAPVKFTVSRQGTKLFVLLPNGSNIPLEALAVDKFKSESLPVAFGFDTTKNEMTVIRNGKERVLTKEK